MGFNKRFSPKGNSEKSIKPDHYREAFVSVNVNIPIDTHKLIQEISHQERIPLAHLVLYAIDNEFDAVSPFTYKVPEPETEHDEQKYSFEASKIYNYLKKYFSSGASEDMLMLCRRSMGLADRSLFTEALRELKSTHMVEEFRPSNVKFGYAPDYKRLRAVSFDIKGQRTKNESQ